MLFAVTKENAVEKLNRRLFRELKRYRDWENRKRVIYPQSTDKDVYKIQYSKELGMWWHSSYAGERNDRYWNIFGTEDPEANRAVNIVCEINMPIDGINLRTAGLWATDGSGNFFLLHSGKIGGGSKGVGKSLFERTFKGEVTEVEIDSKIKEYALVGQLGADNLGEQISEFVHEIARIKSLVRQKKDSVSGGIDHVFSPEFFGTKEYGLSNRITADCNHGIIVSALESEYRKRSIQVFNRHNFLDLYTINSRGKIDRVFEVKTRLSRQVLYTAIGQLFLNTVNIRNNVVKIFVCPAGVKEELVSDLNSLGIQLITFTWQKGKPKFNGLEEFS